MKYKDLTMKLRAAKVLRGEKPCVVTIPKNDGKVYSGKRDELYVMTLTKDNMLYFHGLSRWYKDYEPSKDFRIKLDGIVSYSKEFVNKHTDRYVLVTKNGGLFFPIVFFHGLKDTYETDVNTEAFIRRMKSLGIKEDVNDGQ